MVLHLRPSREQVAGTWKAGNFIGAIPKGRPTGRDSRRDNAAEGDQRRRATGCVVSFCWEQGPGRERWGSLRPKARRPCKKGKKEKGFREVLKKRRSTNASLYLAKL